MRKNINKLNFPSVYSSFNGRKAISPIDTASVNINRWKVEFIDHFGHSAELEAQKYPPSFPH